MYIHLYLAFFQLSNMLGNLFILMKSLYFIIFICNFLCSGLVFHCMAYTIIYLTSSLLLACRLFLVFSNTNNAIV